MKQQIKAEAIPTLRISLNQSVADTGRAITKAALTCESRESFDGYNMEIAIGKWDTRYSRKIANIEIEHPAIMWGSRREMIAAARPLIERAAFEAGIAYQAKSLYEGALIELEPRYLSKIEMKPFDPYSFNEAQYMAWSKGKFALPHSTIVPTLPEFKEYLDSILA
jgi:hypothetical protein